MDIHDYIARLKAHKLWNIVAFKLIASQKLKNSNWQMLNQICEWFGLSSSLNSCLVSNKLEKSLNYGFVVFAVVVGNLKVSLNILTVLFNRKLC